MNIRVRIERVILDGIATGPGFLGSLRTGLETELAEVVAAGNVPSILLTGGFVSQLRSPTVLAPDRSPACLGLDVARAIHASFGQ